MYEPEIEMLQCDDIHMPRISRFRELAEDQQQESELIAADKMQKQYNRRKTRSMKDITPDFIVLHPWRNECHHNGYIFIAHDNKRRRPKILGWLMVHIKEFETRTRNLKIAHVDYISTNQNAMRGIGRKIMFTLRENMMSLGCDFIELMPLPAVVEFYEKLGYSLEFRSADYYTLWLNDTREEKKTKDALIRYNTKLTKDMERLAAEMLAEEKAEFKPIYEQFTEDEKERYQDMQDADDSTRIGMIMTYEESGRDIKQVRIMLT
jgi:hypothetical protein